MIRVRFCQGMECAANGGPDLLALVEDDPLLSRHVDVVVEECLTMCRKGAGTPVVEVADAARAEQVKPYLFAHQSYSPLGIQGVANYVRIVSDAREGPTR